MPRISAPINDYITPLLVCGPFGGVDTTTEKYYIPQTNFSDMLNVIPNASYGGYVTAEGRQVFLGSPLPGPCRGFYRFSRPTADEGYIFACDVAGAGALYYATPGGTPVLLSLPAGATLTAGRQYSMATDLQWLFLTNGLDTPLKVDLNLTVTYWGIVEPVTGPVAIVAGTASTMVGTYEYTTTFGNASQESSQADANSNAVTVNNMGISLTNIPVSTDPQVTQVNIYRIGGSLGQWRLVATLANGTTTYTDTMADSALGHILTVFRDPPPAFTAIANHQERIFGFGTPADPSIVYYSNYEEPWGFNSDTGTMTAGENSLNDSAVGLASTGAVLSLMKTDSQYAVFGDTDSNFSVSRISDIGCTGLRSIWQGNGNCGWLSNQGCYIWNGSGPPTNFSDGNFQQSNIHSFLATLGVADTLACTGFFFDRMIHYSFPTLNKTYLFDTRTNGWFILGWACDQVYYRPEDPQYRVLGTNLQHTGQIDHWFAAPGDFGQAIQAYVVSGITDSGDDSSTKDYRYVIVTAPVQEATLSVLTISNPGTDAFYDNQAVDMSIGGPKFQFSLPTELKGVQIQVKILVISAQQIHIQKVAVHGWITDKYVEYGYGATTG
jgi:hypothetical protein